MLNKTATKLILEKMSLQLSKVGFRRKGKTFCLERDGMIAMINCQKSDESTDDYLKVTANLGIFVTRLAEVFGEKQSIWSCHWNHGIGHLMPEEDDKWWKIHDLAEAESVGNEIASAVVEYGLPKLLPKLDAHALLAFWKAGYCAGITQVQRQRYADKLEQLLASQPPKTQNLTPFS